MGVNGLAVEVVAGDRNDVFAVIGAFGQFDFLALQFARAKLHRFRQIEDLHAGVVVVELARDAPALRLEDVGEHVAQGGLTGVAEMKRARGVGGDVFEQNAFAAVRLVAAVEHAFTEHLTDDFLHGAFLNAQVDEARPGDLDGTQELVGFGIGLERFDDVLSDGAGVLLELSREMHGDGAGDVAVLGILGTLENHFRIMNTHGGEGAADQGDDGFFLLQQHVRE